MRGDVDIQTASALGAIVWSACTYGRGYVGVQQFAQVARGTGYSARTVSVGCDSYGAEWGGLKREPDAKRVAIAGRSVWLSGRFRPW